MIKLDLILPDYSYGDPVWIVMKDFTIRQGRIFCVQFTQSEENHDLRFGISVVLKEASAMLFRPEAELYRKEGEALADALKARERAKTTTL